MIADLLFEKLHSYLEYDEPEAVDGLKHKCTALYHELLTNGTHNEFNLDVHYKLRYLELL